MRWTLPNIITLARICLTPVIALLPFIQGYWPKVIAFVVFLVAAFSDLLDGYLARRYGTTSELGMLLDPIADKLLLFATLIPIFWMTRHPAILARDKVDYAIPWWGSLPLWVAILLVGRELLITGFRFFAKRRGIVIPATAEVSKRLTWAEVVAVGPHVRNVETGDLVLFNPEDRYEVEVRGEEYLILRDRDIHAVASERIEGGTGLYL